LAPEDEKADVDFAAFPMPKLFEGSEEIDPLNAGLTELVDFQKHPDDLRAVRLRWNQASSAQRNFPVNLQAGYQILEFDLDAHTADVLDNPPKDFLDKLRRVQDVELLSAAALHLTPDNAAVANQWEAWYPSAVRRRQLRLKADEIANVPPKFSKARLSPWFSWRDSYLEWVTDEHWEIKNGAPHKITNIVSANVIINEKEQALIRMTGDWQGFQPGAFVRIVGANNPANNGLKQISQNQNPTPDEKRLLFVPGSFSKEEKSDIAQKITFDLKPATVLHPFLQNLKNALDGAQLEDGEEISVEVNPLPSVKLDNLDLLQKQLSPQRDPYGWNILKLLGLSIALTLRKERTGEVLNPEEAQKQVLKKLRELRASGVMTPEIARHLFIEYLFQPAESTKLESEVAKPESKDLLSLVQISLRPAARRYFRYWVFKTKQKETIKVRLKAETNCEIIELTRNASKKFLRNSDNAEKDYSFEIVPPPSGEAVILFRSTDDPAVNGKVPQEFPLTDWLSLNFDALPNEWKDVFQEQSLWAKQEEPAEAWQRFGAYLTRLNSLDDSAKIELPIVSEKIDALFPWLNRFFDAGGDRIIAENSEIPIHTGSGVGIASAYLRTPSPALLSPDAAGRLTYYHRIEDQWAHVYRYYFLPQNRYDRLWLAFAKSDLLFPTEKP
ncbi:MAG TPA: hypothetical protein VF692_13585, partial [Pyrinomonadaceae bacterium]